MSVQAITWAYNQALPTTEKFVLVTLCNYADSDGTCWPSIRRLGQDTSLSLQGVRNALYSLSDRGFLTITHQTGQNGASQRNRYRVCFEKDQFTPIDVDSVNEDDKEEIKPKQKKTISGS